MSDEAFGDAGYDEFLEALGDGEAYYLECSNGHSTRPPASVCPECGTHDLEQESLPAVGEVLTYTKTSVGTPNFEADTPYVVAIADFGPIKLTGQLRGIDANAVETGLSVGATVERRETTGDDLLVFRPL